MDISFEESTSIQSISEDSSNSFSIDDNKFDIPPLETDPCIDLLTVDKSRERTMSDTSSDTVDYDFDTQTSIPLSVESQ